MLKTGRYFFIRGFEYVISRHTEHTSNPEDQGQRGHLFPLFQGNDRLACALGPVGEFLLILKCVGNDEMGKNRTVPLSS